MWKISSPDLGFPVVETSRGVTRWVKVAVLWILAAGALGIAAGRLNAWLLDNVNLVFHEAGHVIFALGGEFIGILGGSLMQVLIPVVCGVALLRRGDFFGVALCGLWTGQSMVNVAIYVGDARQLALPLLGGDHVIHDWNYLLGKLGLLAWDRFLAGMVTLMAVMAILASTALGTLALLSDHGSRNAGVQE
jgi:hypothetical protein